jgi:S1 RNA binding domain protein
MQFYAEEEKSLCIWGRKLISMAEAAEIVSGKVFKIVQFGAFVKLTDGSSGLVHISEISDGYVQDVKDYLEIGMDVNVVILSTEADGRRKLSIKKAEPLQRIRKENEDVDAPFENREEKKKRKKQSVIDKNQQSARSLFLTPPDDDDDGGFGSGRSFEDKLAKFMKESEERQIDVKRQTDNKRGGGYVRKG